MEENYYAEKLHSGKLYQVYQTEIPRVRQYLEAEIDFVRKGLQGQERVLEIGAGYGRILKELASHARSLVGVDISEESVGFGREWTKGIPNLRLDVMDANALDFEEEFDRVLCLQNGLSAIKGDPFDLVRRCLRSLAVGGKAYFSTYSPRFWEWRVAWFREQAAKGLLGEIDEERTKDGVIVCKDGFRAITFDGGDLERLGERTGYGYRVEEVDESSLFLIVEK